MPDSASRSDVLQAIARVTSHRPEVAAAYLFGSVAEERSSSLSDVDVAVLFGEGVPADGRTRETVLAEIGTELRKEMLPAMGEADVRDLERLPLAVQGRVLTRGQLAAANDDELRVAFEVHTRLRYFDFLPFLRYDTREGLRALRRHFTRG